MQLDPKILEQVLAAVSKAPTAPAVTEQVIDNAATQKANEVMKSPSKGSSFMTKLLGVAKTVAPAAMSFIPGASAFAPLVSNVLSTLNDDEWFEAFTGNGASFNQFLTDEVRNGVYGTTFKPRAGMARFITNWNENAMFTENFMPQVIADVRKITNNVLVDNTALYTSAFSAAVKLLALYYTCEKYLNLASALPLNLPLLNAGLPIISPVNISPVTGYTRSLKDFIASTVRLPYALTEYIRWRYGTVFHSDNTGKPALILYDAFDISPLATELDALHDAIADAMSDYTTAGRAGADIKLTYDTHEQKLTVDPPHYDEKEFCLRSNMDIGDGSPVGSNRSPLYLKDGKEVILDSRLDMNAAVQAVLMSTRPSIGSGSGAFSLAATPFLVSHAVLSWYSEKTVQITPLGGTSRFLVTKGWNHYVYKDVMNTIMTEFQKNLALVKHPSTDAAMAIQMTALTATAGSVQQSISGLQGYLLLPSLLSSLQMHNRALTINTIAFDGLSLDGTAQPSAQAIAWGIDTVLSYDTAYLNREAVENIQRCAIRNLVRADYKRKKVADAKASVAEGIAEMATPAAKV